MFIGLQGTYIIYIKFVPFPFRGVPVPEILWTKDGEPLDFDHTEFVSKNKTGSTNLEVIR